MTWRQAIIWTNVDLLSIEQNLIENFIQQNVFENVVCEMAAILSRSHRQQTVICANVSLDLCRHHRVTMS